MSIEENKALVLRFVEEVENKGKIALMDELCTQDFVNYTAIPPFEPALANHKR